MNIDPLSNYDATRQSRSKPRASGQEGSELFSNGFERLSFEFTNKVRESIASAPGVRPEVVERGRLLLSDPNYPSQEIVERIAALVTPLSED